MKPFQQGQLDGLCGFYSIINALRLINGGITEDKCYEHTEDWLLALEKKRGKLAKVVATGLYLNDMIYVLTMASERYDFRRSRPYYKQSKVDLDAFWTNMQDFFSSGNHRAIIIGYYSNLWDDDGHWSVVRKVTDKSIQLFDSYGNMYIRRSSCTTNIDEHGKRTVICPAQTIFLMKNGKQQA